MRFTSSQLSEPSRARGARLLTLAGAVILGSVCYSALQEQDHAKAVSEAAKQLRSKYVFPDVGEKMAADLESRLKAGEFKSMTEQQLAPVLTDHLQAISKDKHLRVIYLNQAPGEGQPRPANGPGGANPAGKYGIEKWEMLDGNIGYIDTRSFMPKQFSAKRIEEAFTSVSDAKALIIDMRRNGGGHPETVALMCSYLFGSDKVHLNDIYDRPSDKTTQFWTTPDVPGKKFVNKPVYVLTSKYTFSGAEEFSYNLKNLKRATIIGEITGGGAHPTMGIKISDRLLIGVPAARAINPITKTNWEGVGVEPDIKIAADQAMEKALELARAPGH